MKDPFVPDKVKCGLALLMEHPVQIGYLNLYGLLLELKSRMKTHHQRGSLEVGSILIDKSL